jgi:hypothetical protein
VVQAAGLQDVLSEQVTAVSRWVHSNVHVTIFAVAEQLALHIVTVLAAIVIQHAKRMRYIILSPVACPALPICTTRS